MDGYISLFIIPLFNINAGMPNMCLEVGFMHVFCYHIAAASAVVESTKLQCGAVNHVTQEVSAGIYIIVIHCLGGF